MLDNGKFDQSAFCIAGSLRDVDIVVTDVKPADEWMQLFDEWDIKCLYPSCESEE